MQWILDILRGAVIGVSNIIPGVSGGTMAVSMGIYDRLINDITILFKRFRQSVIDVLPIGIVLTVGTLVIIKFTRKNEHLDKPFTAKK